VRAGRRRSVWQSLDLFFRCSSSFAPWGFLSCFLTPLDDKRPKTLPTKPSKNKKARAYIIFAFCLNHRSDVTSNCVLKLAGHGAGRCIGLAKRLGTKCCPRARRVISAEVSAQLLQALLDLLHCDPPSLVPTDSPSTLPAGELRPGIKCGALKLSRDRATQTDTNLLCLLE
jgi:hypothetical protein